MDEQLTFFIFTAPALFFALVYLVFRPFRHGCSACSAEANDDTQQNCPKAFASCLIPPSMWILILFFDGDYFAYGMTDWNGIYVFDNELNRSWCKPSNRTETGLRILTRKYIHRSEGVLCTGSHSTKHKEQRQPKGSSEILIVLTVNLRKMPVPDFTKANIRIMSSAPVSFMVVGFQVLMGIKFLCPCRFIWNQAIAFSIFIVPALFAYLMMNLFFKFVKVDVSAEQNNSGRSQSEDPDTNPGTNLASMIPAVVWICVCLIDGDYLACGCTTWNGNYTCENKQHPYCLNWCKPDSDQELESDPYELTRFWINASKVLGYGLGLLFCLYLICKIVKISVLECCLQWRRGT